MQLLVQWLCGPESSPADVKSTVLAQLQQPGIGVARTFYEEVCQCAKRFIGSRGERAEGLALLDLVLDHIPDNVLSQDIVHLMKQLITLSANESFQSTCYVLLHRLILRLRSLMYIQRDMNTEVFPLLAQMLTRRLAVVPASPSLLGLVRATFSHFSKACSSNRDQFERFLFKQLIAAERHDAKSGPAVVQTLAALPRCYVDPTMRHDVSTKHLDMLIRSCLLTEQAFLVAGAGHCDPSQLQNTIYAGADEPLFPAAAAGASAHADLRMVLWKRLLLQLDAVEALLASPTAKDIQHKLVLGLINQIAMCAHSDEHLLFLRPTLIHRAVRIARQLVSGVRTHKMILINARLADFFLHALEVAHQTDPVDMTMLRADVYEAVALWIRNLSPSSLMRRGEALQRIVNMASKDVAAATDPEAVVTRGAEQRCGAALSLQRAIVLAYGDRDVDLVREILLKLIPATVRLSRPLTGALLSCSENRRRLYDLLAAFVLNPNSSLMPPTAEIRDVLREGLCDDVYEVRETCDLHYRMVCNSLQPIECGFSLSHSHALHEHNRQIRRLELTRSERTRSVEVQTDDGTLFSPVTADKAVTAMTAMPIDDEDDDEVDEEDDMSDVEQIASQPINRNRRPAFPYAARAQQTQRPGPRSVKERRAANALCDLEDAAASEAIQLDESASEDDEEMMDEDDLEDDQMEMDGHSSSFRTGRLQPEQVAAAGAGDAVIITDDDDAVAIAAGGARAAAGASASAAVEIAGDLEDEVGDDLDDGDEVDDLEEDVDREGDDDEEMAGDDVCVIEDEDENRQAAARSEAKGNAADVPSKADSIAPVEEGSAPCAITTPEIVAMEKAGDVPVAEEAARPEGPHRGVAGTTNGNDCERVASPKLNGDSKPASVDELSRTSDQEQAKKSSPEKSDQGLGDEVLSATIVPIGIEDFDEEDDEASKDECIVANEDQADFLPEKELASTCPKVVSVDVKEIAKADDQTGAAAVIIPD